MRAIPGAADHVDRSERERARLSLASAIGELRRTGITVIEPILDAAAIGRLRRFAEHAPAKLRLVDQRVIDGTYADRHPDTITVTIPGTFLWANSEAQRVMADSTLHDLVAARFGLRPVVHPPTLYWSCVSQSKLDVAHNDVLARSFHMDFDGVGAIRAHMYLTDVDEGTAPMQFVPGSHRVGALRGSRFGTADFGLAEHLVADRFGAASAITITGPAGTTFVTNPQGLHRATHPREADRLFMVIPIQAGSFAGYVNRRRAVPVRDHQFGRMLGRQNGPLRLFVEGHESAEATTPLRVSRLA